MGLPIFAAVKRVGMHYYYIECRQIAHSIDVAFIYNPPRTPAYNCRGSAFDALLDYTIGIPSGKWSAVGSYELEEVRAHLDIKKYKCNCCSQWEC